MPGQTILMIGTFDTKGAEYAFLAQRIETHGHRVLAMNIGVMGTTKLFNVDIEADQVARAADTGLQRLREGKDRGMATRAMGRGAAALTLSLYEQGQFAGIIGMGGGGGTSMITQAMQALPVGVPKVCVSTVAGVDTSPYVGIKDVTLIPSIVDVAGINRVSRIIFSRAAGAVCGMVDAQVPTDDQQKPVIAASMFGNSTQCVDACREVLTKHDFEVLVFHATGTGGRTMEALIDQGLVDACLDITTTEWADEVCGGVMSAGPDRLSAAGRAGIPHLIVPGCVDMANFGGIDTVPQKYRDAGRLFYQWNPAVTLMRTNAQENERMGKVFAQMANAAKGPVAFLIPLGGVSILDGDGERFCDRAVDRLMFDTIKQNLRDDIEFVEMDANINDAAFSAKAADMMLQLIAQRKD
jgi:uncharacterized protein (UPF0261 family)